VGIHPFGDSTIASSVDMGVHAVRAALRDADVDCAAAPRTALCLARTTRVSSREPRDSEPSRPTGGPSSNVEAGDASVPECAVAGEPGRADPASTTVDAARLEKMPKGMIRSSFSTVGRSGWTHARARVLRYRRPTPASAAGLTKEPPGGRGGEEPVATASTTPTRCFQKPMDRGGRHRARGRPVIPCTLDLLCSRTKGPLSGWRRGKMPRKGAGSQQLRAGDTPHRTGRCPRRVQPPCCAPTTPASQPPSCSRPGRVRRRRARTRCVDVRGQDTDAAREPWRGRRLGLDRPGEPNRGASRRTMQPLAAAAGEPERRAALAKGERGRTGGLATKGGRAWCTAARRRGVARSQALASGSPTRWAGAANARVRPSRRGSSVVHSTEHDACFAAATHPLSSWSWVQRVLRAQPRLRT